MDAYENNERGNLGLAPMDGVTDFPSRIWFYLTGGVRAIGTPFLRATASYPSHKIPESLWPELYLEPGCIPYRLHPQVMASCPDDFIRAADFILSRFPEVELNCGCPSPKVVGGGAGSCLLQEPDTFYAFVYKISQEIGGEKLSVKMRTGYSDDIHFASLLKSLANIPIRRLSIHGRTRDQKYRGQSNWKSIESARLYVSPNTEIVGSGDICSFDSYCQRQSPAVDSFLIGRGAIRNPWLFLEIMQQSPVHLSREVILFAFASFAWLHEYYQLEFETLKGLFETRGFTEACLDQMDRWESLWIQLENIGGWSWHKRHEWSVSSRTLGRVKMLWHYVRSSLDPDTKHQQLLRLKNLGDFMRALEEHLPSSATLNHHSSEDWIYAGETRPT